MGTLKPSRSYRDILGFSDIWNGGMKDERNDRVDMNVPQGTDWPEYMLKVHNPSPKILGVTHHIALGDPSVADGYKTILARGLHPDKPRSAATAGDSRICTTPTSPASD